ncbi:hypothetical protein CRG98_024602 [Punica granatum]|uniref:Uncharacterized protein n=1 Tax=Punica granatum TaxID=22663 RepID=A0A2I0JFF9_PUNGR|nr:hypothetical protein CRG98_024602 [Punica granatum]
MGAAQNHNLGHPFSLYPSYLPCPSRPQRFSLKSLFRNQRSVKKQIRNLAGRWSFHVKEMLKAGELSRDALVHVQYGVPIYMIATINRDIVDLDVVYEGQHLRIPAHHRYTQKTERSSLLNFTLNPQQIHKRAMNTINGLSLQQQNFTLLIPQKLPHAKATGYFLVLVPLIAFCIRCVIGVFCTKTTGPSLKNHHDAHEPEQHHDGPSRSMRWKSALLEPKEPDTVDIESATDFNNSAEDNQTEVSFEDISGGYRKLEMDYQKFLSECGITDCGYWRGGSPPE